MKVDELKAQLERHEGRRLKPYDDGQGNLTIGIGRNLTGAGISDQECDLLFTRDLVAAIATVRDATAPNFDALGDVRQHVLIDMAFQLGRAGFFAFGRMLAAVNNRDFATAAREMRTSAWAREVPTRAAELIAMMEKEGEIA